MTLFSFTRLLKLRRNCRRQRSITATEGSCLVSNIQRFLKKCNFAVESKSPDHLKNEQTTASYPAVEPETHL